MTHQPKELTREELHNLVWETPISRLADRFGISGNGLAKICRRLEVPYPPRGWWAKKAAGKALKTGALPPARPETIVRVSILPTENDTGDLKAQIHQRRDEIGDIAVARRLTNPHPIIARWRQARQTRIEEARRERDPWRRSLYSVSDFTSTDRRRHRVLQALFEILERQGATISEDDRGKLIAMVADEKIEFSLQEKSRQVTRPLTDEERRWESWNKSGVKTELEPTGHFQFSIRSWIDQPIRKNWLEGDKRSIEGMLAEIAATFLVLGRLLADRTRVRREQAKLHAERQRQLDIERERRKLDENRWNRFLEIAEGWRRIEDARAFLARLRELDLPDPQLIDDLTISDWLDWAEERVAKLDPSAQGVECVFRDIAQVSAWAR